MRMLLVGALGILGITAATPAAAQERTPEDFIRAVEGRQSEPGESGLGDLTLDELMSRLGVPGVSVAVIRDFQIHWSRGYGIADVETGAAVDTETMFQAASISKPVAAMATLKAVQDGLFTLDDDINDILRSWTLDGGELTADRPVTPRTLTSHTSGLGDGFGFPGYDPSAPIPTPVQVLEGHDLSNVGPVFMERPPMTFFEYSGGGVTVMQQALSDARGRPFADIMRDDVLDPIGMVNSSYQQPIDPRQDRNAARAHDREGRSRGAKWHVYPEMAAAGLWTTPADLARFAIEVQKSSVGESNRVLDRATVHEMLSPVGVGPFAAGFAVLRIGEGWYFSHGGSNWGFRATLLAHKVKGYGLAIMTNADQGGALADELSRRIQHAYEWDSVAEAVRRGSGR
jgi:CubicO group peptidase (beta-lactamase class C family)